MFTKNKKNSVPNTALINTRDIIFQIEATRYTGDMSVFLIASNKDANGLAYETLSRELIPLTGVLSNPPRWFEISQTLVKVLWNIKPDKEDIKRICEEIVNVSLQAIAEEEARKETSKAKESMRQEISQTLSAIAAGKTDSEHVG